jgi:hypothetical protein
MYRFSAFLDGPIAANLGVVDVPTGLRLGEVLNVLHNEMPAFLSLAAAIILRPPVSTPIPRRVLRDLDPEHVDLSDERLTFLQPSATGLDENFDRVRDVPIHILASDGFTHHLSRNINPNVRWSPLNGPGVRQAEVLAALQTAELDFLIEQGRAEFPDLGRTFYRAPSGDFVRSFLRVGNIQTSRAALDAVFFWLLPHLKRCHGILADTWSIGSLALNISRRLAAYRGTGERPCPVEFISEYFDAPVLQAVDARLQLARLVRIAQRRQAGPNSVAEVMLLMSAVNTGRLYRNVIDLLAQEGIATRNVRFVCLYKLGGPAEGFATLRDLSADSPYDPLPETVPPPATTPVPIDRITYFPAIQQDIEHRIPSALIARFRESILDAYIDADLIKVHHYEANRHHAIYVDTVRLTAHATFITKLQEMVQALSPAPALIITPDHPAGQQMAATAASALSLSGTHDVFAHGNLLIEDHSPERDLELRRRLTAVPSHSAILIVDDAFITGTRLVEYQKHLRRLSFTGTVHYIAGIARPNSKRSWDRQKRYFCASMRGKTYTAQCVEYVLLPNWQEDKCPWCLERGALNRAPETAQRLLGKTGTRHRRTALESDAEFGAGDQIFLRPAGSTRLSFTNDSFFGPVKASDSWIFASVASAIQHLRCPSCEEVTKLSRLGPPRLPIVTVLRYQDYLTECWTDSLLRAAILRATRPYELIYSNADVEADRHAAALDLVRSTAPTNRDLNREVAIACMVGKFASAPESDGALLNASSAQPRAGRHAAKK